MDDYTRFTKILIDQLPIVERETFEIISNPNKITSLKYRLKESGESACYNSATLLSFLEFAEGTDPVDLLSEKVIGCDKRCPFCKAPCKYTCKDHAGDHSALQHCPSGVAGYHKSKTEKLCTHNCQSAVASEGKFRNQETSETYVPYKTYRTYYPDWDIAPDRKMESSIYWKWFMNNFHDDLVSYFEVKHADLPDEWKEIQWEDAEKSLLNVF